MGKIAWASSFLTLIEPSILQSRAFFPFVVCCAFENDATKKKKINHSSNQRLIDYERDEREPMKDRFARQANSESFIRRSGKKSLRRQFFSVS